MFKCNLDEFDDHFWSLAPPCLMVTALDHIWAQGSSVECSGMFWNVLECSGMF